MTLDVEQHVLFPDCFFCCFLFPEEGAGGSMPLFISTDSDKELQMKGGQTEAQTLRGELSTPRWTRDSGRARAALLQTKPEGTFSVFLESKTRSFLRSLPRSLQNIFNHINDSDRSKCDDYSTNTA